MQNPFTDENCATERAFCGRTEEIKTIKQLCADGETFYSTQSEDTENLH